MRAAKPFKNKLCGSERTLMKIMNVHINIIYVMEAFGFYCYIKIQKRLSHPL